MVTVPNKKVLEALPSTPEEGEYALVEDEKKVYQYMGGQWNLMDMKNNLKANLYDINSTAIAQLPQHDASALAADAHIVDEFIKKDFPDVEYFMLMCKNYAKTFYATVFVPRSQITETVGEAVMSCLVNTGTIHEVSVEKDHVEFWIKYCDDMYCFLFFPYDFGVVEVF